MLRPLLAAVLIAACATPVAAADGPGGMPVFKPQTLVLTNVPKATGKAISLFNGKDLNDWDAWLGYADPAQTYRPDHGPSLGAGGKGAKYQHTAEKGQYRGIVQVMRHNLHIRPHAIPPFDEQLGDQKADQQ